MCRLSLMHSIFNRKRRQHTPSRLFFFPSFETSCAFWRTWMDAGECFRSRLSVPLNWTVVRGCASPERLSACTRWLQPAGIWVPAINSQTDTCAARVYAAQNRRETNTFRNNYIHAILLLNILISSVSFPPPFAVLILVFHYVIFVASVI